MRLYATNISSWQPLGMLGMFSRLAAALCRQLWHLADALASWSPGAQSLVSQLLYLSI